MPLKALYTLRRARGRGRASERGRGKDEPATRRQESKHGNQTRQNIHELPPFLTRPGIQYALHATEGRDAPARRRRTSWQSFSIRCLRRDACSFPAAQRSTNQTVHGDGRVENIPVYMNKERREIQLCPSRPRVENTDRAPGETHHKSSLLIHSRALVVGASREFILSLIPGCGWRLGVSGMHSRGVWIVAV